ncbi:MAG: helix-turn-helix transcriptional regulator [Polaromonas sp.]|nr:helix-turn-helix transcriptional regulator [Polaromonas sp.]
MNSLLNSGLIEALRPDNTHPLDSAPDLLAQLVDVLAHGVVIATGRGQVVHANQAARIELGCARALGEAGGEIHAVTPGDRRVLQNALNLAAAGKRSLINLSGGGSSLSLAVVPLKQDGDDWEIRIALLFARAEVCESGMFGFFARSYGLTQTEEQVLAILCRGLSTPEIAVQLKVAVSTVRSHVRSLCAKTASSGVRELVNRVAVLPPVAPLQRARIH